MPDVYQQQIDLAQEFLNENPQADVSRVQCLLRKIIPTLYHPFIDKLHCQHTIGSTINVWGGQNQIAPQAKFATQYYNKDRPVESDTKNTEQDLYEIDKIVRRHGNIKDLYKDFRSQEFELNYSANNNGKGTEVMFFSDNCRLTEEMFNKIHIKW